MNCADLEILLADYLEGTLLYEQKSALENHLKACAGCREMAEDASNAVAFMERAATVEPPPELVTRILYEITSGPSHAAVKPSWARRLFGKRVEAILQPRYAMGMAMTVLSFAMLGRLSGIEVRQLSPSDLDPVKVWMAAEDRVHRTWERSVKYYESLRLVFEIQTQLKEWTDEQAAAAEAKNPPGGDEMSSDAKVVGYCRACGKALDEVSVRTAHGTIFCEEHVPMTTEIPASPAVGQTLAAVDVSPYTSATPPPIPNPEVSPGLAFGLGFIPGVGAIYNGQYAKGLVHAIVIGLIISIMSSAPGNLEPLLAFLMIGFWLYMPFEAYHTAKRRRLGQPVDEFSSLVPMRPGGSRIPVAPLVLIAIGVIFLLDNLHILELRVLLHYWPVVLIVAGVYMLYNRVRGGSTGSAGGER